ncbi:serine hydrolase domain-containing protein [Actinophytocola xanthii]|uniref:Serine hydrolase n=1 Tax=Actinophytocola xanthii TaxID=1912961 RepID=A0A1Q8CLC4_9PSEU|nr:serine hydrolase domain-containing protein [Actinophytocola xanthii]OLF15156.1 serine hydrolase [Actinophytocola xanthii]
MTSDSAGGVERRRLLGWGGLAAAGVAAGVPVVGTSVGHADPARPGRIPPDTLPGGAYDRFVARLAAEDRFSGVVLLSYRGRTVLSRGYGMADREKGVRNHENVAFNLSSASQPFLSVAVLQLAQQGRLALSDTVGTHLTGFPDDIADQVTIHHLLLTLAGLDAPMPDWQRVFHSVAEVHEAQRQWARQARLVAVPGSSDNGHRPGAGVGLSIAAQVVEAVSGMTFWDYVHERVFRRCGMTGSAYYTRQQWLTDERIAHPYMMQADGSRVDGVRNLDKGTVHPGAPGRNPGRAFVGYASGDGFATAPDLVRFANALRVGAVLAPPYVDLFTSAKIPGYDPTSYHTYTMPISIIGDVSTFGRGGGGGGVGANWTVYGDSGWVGVILSNYDEFPLLEMCMAENEAVTGVAVDPPGGG